GKSTFIRAVSAATPRVADYPFTTLYHNLGVLRVEQSRSFVVADIPRLIEGDADGAGVGAMFLKQVQRTSLLLHLVDAAALEGNDPAEQVRAIEHELGKFDPELLHKPRWLVLNKLDLLPEEEREARVAEIVAQLQWTGPVFPTAAISKEGTWFVCQQAMEHLDQQRAREAAEPDEDASAL